MIEIAFGVFFGLAFFYWIVPFFIGVTWGVSKVVYESQASLRRHTVKSETIKADFTPRNTNDVALKSLIDSYKSQS